MPLLFTGGCVQGCGAVFLSMVSSSVISSTVSRRRALPTMSRGLVVATNARAWVADRKFRRHVQHGLAVMDQPVHDMPTDAVAALHRPYPLGEPAPGRQHFRIANWSVPNFPAVITSPSSLITSIVAERLCGSIPIITGIQVSLPQRDDVSKEGTATSSRTDPFPATPRAMLGEPHAMREPHQ